MAEETTRLLLRFGRRYAAGVRLATLVPIGAIALFRASPEHLPATAVAVGVAAAWTCAYGWWLLRAEGSRLVLLDVLVLLGVCLSVFWTDAVEETNTGWVRLLVVFACVSCQWHTAPLPGAVAALVVAGGALSVVAAAGADASVLRGQVWAVVAAALSRAAWLLVQHAAGRVDRTAAEAEQARRESLVAQAVHAAERELANALHDTAATTLLLVGTGQVPVGASWLAPQARRDLDRLRSRGEQPPPRADLVVLLHADLDVTHLAVTLEAPDHLLLPFEVASAAADAAREALTNVRRHAGTGRATVRLRGDPRGFRLDVADDGTGFSPEQVPATRRGLRESVRGRMSRVGGAATVTSAAGVGTVVRLEWRSGDE